MMNVKIVYTENGLKAALEGNNQTKKLDIFLKYECLKKYVF